MKVLLAMTSGLGALGASGLARAEEYTAYDPSTAQSQVSAPLYVIIAYAVIWLLILYFAVVLWRRQQRIDLELQTARSQLEELRASAPGRGATPR